MRFHGVNKEKDLYFCLIDSMHSSPLNFDFPKLYLILPSKLGYYPSS